MKGNLFTGTAALAGLALRRDRVRLTIWLVGIALFLFLTTSVYAGMSADEIASLTMVMLADAGARALSAPVSEVTGFGDLAMLRSNMIIAVLVALMSAQAVVRHTRHNEETGCAEMVGSTVVGRYAGPAAALLVTAGANIVAVLTALALIANGLPAGGSFAAGAAYGATGIVFAGIAAVAAQFSETARGAGGLSGLALAFAFLLSSLGNILGEVKESGLGVTPAWPIWLSPVGWSTQMYAFAENNWWVLVLFATLFAALAWGAFSLVNRRDVGSGILPARRGPADAPRGLLSPLGLAWRLQRGAIIGWAIPMFVFGLACGAISNEFGELAERIEHIQDMFGLTKELFLFSMIAWVAIILTIYTIQSLMRMRSEETGGTLEPVLATAVNRSRWMIGHIICAAGGTVALLLLFALSSFAATGLPVSEAGDFVKTALYFAVPVLLLGGFTVAAFGLLPRWTAALSWVGFFAALITGPVIAPFLDLPEAVREISPFSHVSFIPGEVTAAPIVILLAVTVTLFAAGLVSFRRRNLSL